MEFKAISSFLMERMRNRLGNASSLPLLALMGLLSGIAVGLVIIAFRGLIESSQAFYLPHGDPEQYEDLPWPIRVYAILGGSALIALIYYFFAHSKARVGVVHVLERLAYHEGHLPWKNAIMQFFAGAVAIISGHSVGREGPSVHLGAATASLIGQRLRLPNNSIRILVACGTAAAIASSFNTPLAGVIFAMEVVMMEYTIIGFTPVILAAVSATALNRLIYSNEAVFLVPALDLVSVWELLVIVIMGILIGAYAALFTQTLASVTSRSRRFRAWQRVLLAGFLTAVLAVLVPEVMGIGYDTVNESLLGSLAISTLCLVAIAKLLATAFAVGLGIPGGMIGPSLMMGALFGSLVGQVVNLLPTQISHPGLYAMLGMGAMMGACLQAPLSALVALLELTANQNIIFPGMLAIVSANLAARELFGQDSVFLSQMRESGLDYRNDPIAQSLRRYAVSSVMDQDFIMINPSLTPQQAETILEDKPKWLLIRRPDANLLMPSADLARFLEQHPELHDEIDLLEIPSKRKQLAAISQQATLQQARNQLLESDAEALYVIRRISSSADRIFGIVTLDSIEQNYGVRKLV